jgi:hypothetical protein
MKINTQKVSLTFITRMNPMYAPVDMCLMGGSSRERIITFLVIKNSGAIALAQVICYRGIWEKRGLFIFFFHKWINPQDYISKDNLFYAANRALANAGKVLFVNFKNHAA